MTSGIYAITGPDGRLYIGSSTNIPRRRDQHEEMLQMGNHHCWRLQEAWWEHAGQGFDFTVLEECPVDELHIHEQAWINGTGRRKLYNTQMTVARRPGGKPPPGIFLSDRWMQQNCGCQTLAMVLMLAGLATWIVRKKVA